MKTVLSASLLVTFYSCAGFELKEYNEYYKTRSSDTGVADEEAQCAPIVDEQGPAAAGSVATKGQKKEPGRGLSSSETVTGTKVSTAAPMVCSGGGTSTGSSAFEPGDRHFELTLSGLVNKTYGSGEYTPGGYVNYYTNMGLGLKAALEFYFNKSSSVYTQFQIMKTPLSGNFNNFYVSQPSTTSTYWDLGYRYTFNRYISVRGFLGLRQDYIFYATSSTRGVYEQFWHGLLGVGADYSFFESGKFSLDGGTDLVFSLGTTTSRHSTNTGLLFGTEIRPTIEFTYPVFAFFRFEYFKLNDSLLVGHSGKAILFGLGWKFKFWPQ